MLRLSSKCLPCRLLMPEQSAPTTLGCRLWISHSDTKYGTSSWITGVPHLFLLTDMFVRHFLYARLWSDRSDRKLPGVHHAPLFCGMTRLFIIRVTSRITMVQCLIFYTLSSVCYLNETHFDSKIRVL